MAKVTIVIEDINEADRTLSIHAEFDAPGESYEEMTGPNMTPAVSLGMTLIRRAQVMSDSFSGKLEDEFGNTKEVSPESPL